MSKKSGNLLYKKHIISIIDFNRKMLELVVETATMIKQTKPLNLLKGKIIGNCFFEPSTRTRLSFEVAIKRLGGEVIGFDDATNSSLQKGETLADSVRIISSYTDALIIRYPKEGATRLAAEFSSVPIINGGDGANQHPTQTLLDLFSIYECQGRLDNLTIACVGDLKYGRTTHSLVQALTYFNANFIFISPESLGMPNYMLEELNKKGIFFRYANSIEDVIRDVDILYMTRIQKERFDETEYKYMTMRYLLEAESLKNAKSSMRVLHPLPRLNELSIDVDNSQHAYYFQQAKNGVYARMALLILLLHENIPNM